jgi:Arc/MetJ-type ribon-helix-helix transcriptional regulator
METVMAALARLNATIPTLLDQYADVRVETGDFGNKSEYIRHLIREDRERHLQSEVTLINQMIQADSHRCKNGDQQSTTSQITRRYGL